MLTTHSAISCILLRHISMYQVRRANYGDQMARRLTLGTPEPAAMKHRGESVQIASSETSSLARTNDIPIELNKPSHRSEENGLPTMHNQPRSGPIPSIYYPCGCKTVKQNLTSCLLFPSISRLVLSSVANVRRAISPILASRWRRFLKWPSIPPRDDI